MSKLLAAIKSQTVSFAHDEEGAQIIEYALIIAVVSLGLIVLFNALKTTSFNTWITKVGTCLTSGNCT